MGPVRASRSSISCASRTALNARRRRSTAAACGERGGEVASGRTNRRVSVIWQVPTCAPSTGVARQRKGVPRHMPRRS
jgi:hypothetical protein